VSRSGAVSSVQEYPPEMSSLVKVPVSRSALLVSEALEPRGVNPSPSKIDTSGTPAGSVPGSARPRMNLPIPR
jgi:hypothetical protein